MKIDRKTPCVKSADRLLTIEEAEAAIEHASAFITLAQSLDNERFGQAAGKWFSRYGVAHHE